MTDTKSKPAEQTDQPGREERGFANALKETCRLFVSKDKRWRDHLKEKSPASSGIWGFLRSPKDENDEQSLGKSGIWPFLRSQKGKNTDL